jgi:hypothetical protein
VVLLTAPLFRRLATGNQPPRPRLATGVPRPLPLPPLLGLLMRPLRFILILYPLAATAGLQVQCDFLNKRITYQ